MEELSSADRQLREYSTLDLCRFDSFTLIINSSHFQSERASKLEDLLKEETGSGASIPVNFAVLGVDFEIVFEDQAREWLERFGLNPDQSGGVLIRPDQHILHVLDGNVSAQELATVLRSAAGW